MTRWIAGVLFVLLIAGGAWWWLQRSPYTGSWVNVGESSDTLLITRNGAEYSVQPAGSALLRMKLEGDRLRPAVFGSTLELIYDAATDQLRYPIFSDTERRYRRVE